MERVEGAFVDGRVRQGVAGRTKKQLAFNEPGAWTVSSVASLNGYTLVLVIQIHRLFFSESL